MKYAIVVAMWILVFIGMTLILKTSNIRYEARQREIAASDSVRKQVIIDSLSGELFQLQSENGRYEMTLEHLKEVDPKDAKEFDRYYNHETE